MDIPPAAAELERSKHQHCSQVDSRPMIYVFSVLEYYLLFKKKPVVVEVFSSRISFSPLLILVDTHFSRGIIYHRRVSS